MALSNADLITRFKADTSNFDAGVRRAKAEVVGMQSAGQNLGGTLKGAFAVTAVLSFGSAVLALSNHFGDMYDKSLAAAVSFESYQRLAILADGAGVSVDSLTRNVTMLQRAIVQAESGKGKQFDAFTKLGIDAKSLKGLAPEDQLAKISTGLSHLASQEDRVSVAMAIMGKSGASSLGLLNGEFAKAIQNSKTFFGILTSEEGAALDNFTDKIHETTTKLKGLMAKGVAQTIMHLTPRSINDDAQVTTGNAFMSLGADTGATAMQHGLLAAGRGVGNVTGVSEVSESLGKMGKAIITVSDGLTQLSSKLKTIADDTSDVFKRAGDKVLAMYDEKMKTINDLLGKNDDSFLRRMAKDPEGDTLQLATSEFKEGVRDALEYAKTPGATQKGIKEKINAIPISGNAYDWTDRWTYSQVGSNTAQLNAVEQLKKLLLDPKKAPVQVNVKIEADKDGVFRAVVTNNEFNSAAGNAAKTMLSQEARGVAR